MIYGLYLSAAGVMANSHRQDVIANNLANGETVGFKRDVPLFQQRLTEAQQRRLASGSTASHQLLEALGGGLFVAPTAMDRRQGELEMTGNATDVAIMGRGYFQVEDAGGRKLLTRDGRFMVDASGRLVMANATGQRVLDEAGKPIQLDGKLPVSIGEDGQVTQEGQAVARLGVFDVADSAGLVKRGGNMLEGGGGSQPARARGAVLKPQFVERANVDPAVELARLMEIQRQLEANANMIRYQDQTLAKLVNEVGRIG